MLEIRVFGQFAVDLQGRPVNLGRRQRRIVLAVLVVHSGGAVSTERLIDELWGEAPPSSARKTLQSHVAHLRRALNVDSELLVAEGEGYVMRIDPDAIDSHRFEQTLQQARDIRQARPDDAIRELDRALGMFTGTPFAGISDNALSLRVEASRLEALKLAALEDRLELLVHLGNSDSAAAEAERLVAENPLRERLWEILMLALYRSGRQAEALHAFSRARRILTEELGIEPSASLQALEQRILEHDPDLDADPIGRTGPDQQPLVRNPYKGLRYFDESDSPDFFGREELVRRLEERMRARRYALVSLVGPSGAGKSSAVRAGLIPRLREAGRSVAVMFPGEAPIEALVGSVARETGLSVDDVRAGFLTGSGLGQELVVVVDQLEEVYTAADDLGAVDRFLGLLAEPPPGIEWVATVRSDYLGKLLSDPHLGGMLSDSTILVPPLQDHEVKAAVEKPAQRLGLEVEPELTAAVVRDVAEQPASLPLLQYALADLFDRLDRRTLRVVDYRAAGGISGALVRRADELFDRLSRDEQHLTRALLLELVAVTDEGDAVRRRMHRSTLAEELGSSVDRVIDEIAAIRLLTLDRDPDTGEATLEIAHEALIAAWPRLSRWIGDAKEDLHIRRRLADAAAEWESSGRDDDYLVSGSRLLAFTSWKDTTDLRPTGSVTEFLSRSVENERLREDRQTLLRRVVVGSISAVALIAVVLAVVALAQREAAKLEAERANEQALLAEVRLLASRSIASVGVDPQGALSDALEAVEISRGDGDLPGLREAEEALRLAVQSVRTVLDLDANTFVQFSSRGDEIIGHAADGASAWSTGSGTLLRTANDSSGPMIGGVYIESQDLVVTSDAAGTMTVWDINSGEALTTVDVGQAPYELAISPSGDTLAISYPGEGSPGLGQVRAWDTDTWEPVFANTAPLVFGIAFNEDGSKLAATTAEGVMVWSTASGELITNVPPSDFGFYASVVFVGDHIAYSSDDTVRIYDLDSGTEIDTLVSPRTDIIELAAFEDELIAGGTFSGEVVVWDIDSGRQEALLAGLGSEILDIDFHPSGEMVAAATDASLRVWDFTSEGSYEWYTVATDSPVRQTESNADGSVLVGVPGSDPEHGIPVWDATSGDVLRTLEGHALPAFRARFGPGDLLATGSFDGTARIWDVATGGELHRFPGSGPVVGTSLSSDGSRFAYSSGALDCRPAAGSVDIRALPEGDLVFSQGVAGSTLWDVRLAPDGSWFAASACGLLTVWSIADSTLMWEAEVGDGPNTPAAPIAISPDGSLIAAGGFDGVVTIWDSADGRIRHSLVGHGPEVRSVEFSPDGSVLASGGADGTSRIWNVAGGFEQVTIGGHQWVEDVTFSPDGRRLITTGRDGIIRVHALDVDDLVMLASEKLERFVDTARSG